MQVGRAAPAHPALAPLAWEWGSSEQSGAIWNWLTKGLWLKQVLGDNHRLQRAEVSLSQQHD